MDKSEKQGNIQTANGHGDSTTPHPLVTALTRSINRIVFFVFFPFNISSRNCYVSTTTEASRHSHKKGRKIVAISISQILPQILKQFSNDVWLEQHKLKSVQQL